MLEMINTKIIIHLSFKFSNNYPKDILKHFIHRNHQSSKNQVTYELLIIFVNQKLVSCSSILWLFLIQSCAVQYLSNKGACKLF